MPNFSGLWTERQQMQVQGAGTWPAFPGAPTIGTATAGTGSASVAFTAPSYTGYPAGITSYTATSSPGGFTGTGASSPITVSGLTNGTTYTFTVTATNATGTGAASAASNSVTPSVNYIEDVFSTYLYAGNSSSQTITNGIDLSTKGGLVWLKSRTGAYNHNLMDTARGMGSLLESNTTAAQQTGGYSTATTTGFSINVGYAGLNETGSNYASWTFRKQPKFFDVVTWTGDGNAKTINHSLGSTPGCIIIKATSTTSSWGVYHQSVTGYGLLNATNAWTTPSIVTATTDTTFSIIAGWNDPSVTYVAYLFAHDAGGFGLTGTDNVISCGSYTGSGGTTTPLQVTLGYEPQWVLVKPSSAIGKWAIADTMRGMMRVSDGSSQFNELDANASTAEATNNYGPAPTATGFAVSGVGFPNVSGVTYIYIAIRRGPMKVPTDGTTVFKAYTQSGTPVSFSVGFPTDLALLANRSGDALNTTNNSRLVGSTAFLTTSTTAAQDVGISWKFDQQNNFQSTWTTASTVNYCFGRAPSYMDVVCYTGTGVDGQNIKHNLGVAPELIIVKKRSSASSTGWRVYSSTLGNGNELILNTTAASGSSSVWFSTTPTSTQFTVGLQGDVGASGSTYVAYLFATCAGVSKVGSYTGTGALLTIDCGFTGGARFVLIKRTDSADNWYFWDTTRGMVAGTDPSLAFNSATAESNANSVYTTTGGFQILASPARNINGAGNTYIYLAIA